MAQTLQALIEKELEQVQKEREDLLAKRQEIEQQLEGLDRRLLAAQNYQATLEGKLPLAESKARKPRESSGPRAPRGSREALKNQIVDHLKKHPEGLVTSQITAAFSEVQGLGNLLSLLKKEERIRQDAKRGPYYLSSK
jgi:hypothetical protein